MDTKRNPHRNVGEQGQERAPPSQWWSNVIDVYTIFVKNSKRDAPHQSDLAGEVQLPHLCHVHQQQAKTEMKNQNFRTI